MAMSEDNKIIDINGHDDQALSALYQGAGKPHPSTELDDSIRAAARKSVKRPGLHIPRWLSSIAATIIVGILVVQLYPVAVNDLESVESLTAPKQESARRQGKPLSERVQQRKSESLPTPSRDRSIPHAAPGATSPQTGLKNETVPPPETPLYRSKVPGGTPALEAGERLKSGDTAEITRAAEKELQEIIDLMEKGDLDEAKKRLSEFQQRYPRFKIPDRVISGIQ